MKQHKISIKMKPTQHLPVSSCYSSTAHKRRYTSNKLADKPDERDLFFFHTKKEDNPWALFDLGANHRVESLHLLNRSKKQVLERINGLAIHTSTDCLTWTNIQLDKENDFLSNLLTGKHACLKLDLKIRFIRISLPKQDAILHLRHVSVSVNLKESSKTALSIKDAAFQKSARIHYS